MYFGKHSKSQGVFLFKIRLTWVQIPSTTNTPLPPMTFGSYNNGWKPERENALEWVAYSQKQSEDDAWMGMALAHYTRTDQLLKYKR